MGRRVWHELRVREKVGSDRWVKKSKFYEVRSPGDAVSIYEKHARKTGVDYTIMWCEKDRRHGPERLAAEMARLQRDIFAEQDGRRRSRLGDVGEFLSLGGQLLSDLKKANQGKSSNRRNHG